LWLFGVHEIIGTGACFCKKMRGGPSSDFVEDDEEQIVRCLGHVRDVFLVFLFLASRSKWFASFSGS
jgi:hypothetical protein